MNRGRSKGWVWGRDACHGPDEDGGGAVFGGEGEGSDPQESDSVLQPPPPPAGAKRKAAAEPPRDDEEEQTFANRPLSAREQRELQVELATMIFATGMPLSVVDEPAFRELMHALRPAFRLPSRALLERLKETPLGRALCRHGAAERARMIEEDIAYLEYLDAVDPIRFDERGFAIIDK